MKTIMDKLRDTADLMEFLLEVEDFLKVYRNAATEQVLLSNTEKEHEYLSKLINQSKDNFDKLAKKSNTLSKELLDKYNELYGDSKWKDLH